MLQHEPCCADQNVNLLPGDESTPIQDVHYMFQPYNVHESAESQGRVRHQCLPGE